MNLLHLFDEVLPPSVLNILLRKSRPTQARGFRSALIGVILLLLASIPALAQSAYTWIGGTSGNWSTTTDWSPNGAPGAGGSTTTDIANLTNFLASGTVTYDGGASGYLGALNLTQTGTTANSILSLSKNLTLNAGATLYSTTGNGTTSGIVQIDLGNSTLLVGSGANFTIGSSTLTNLESTANTVQITNITGTTAGTGAIAISGSLTLAVTGTSTNGYNTTINAPVTLNSGGVINIANSTTYGAALTDRLYVNGNFTSTGTGAVIEATGTGSVGGNSGSTLYFQGANTTIGNGTTVSNFNGSGAITFAGVGLTGSNNLTYIQTVSLGTLVPSMQIRDSGFDGSSGYQVVLTKIFSSTATSGAIQNAINSVAINPKGSTYESLVFTLGSNLNLAAGNTAPFTYVMGGGAFVQGDIDLVGYEYNATTAGATVAFAPSSSNGTISGTTSMNILNSGASSISGSNGVFVVGSFNLSNNDIGIGNGVILQATASGTNNLGFAANGVTAINPGSTFYYSGTGSTGAAVASNRPIGQLQIGDGAHASTLNLASALTVAGDVAVNSNSVLDLTGATLTESGVGPFGGLNGGGIVRNNTSSTTATLALNTTNGGGSFSGSIINNSTGTGIVALSKNGSGTQTLRGVNTYSGATAVNGGAIVVSGSLTATSAVSVASGAALTVNGMIAATANPAISGTLAGTGTVDGNLNLTGGVIAPGTPGAPLTLSGATINLDAASSFAFTLNGSGTSSDSVASASTVTLAPGATLTLNDPHGQALNYAAGTVIQVFTGSPNFNGTSFTYFNLPPLAAGLQWTAPSFYSGVQEGQLVVAPTAGVAFSSGTYSQNFGSLIISGTAPWQNNVTIPGWYSWMPAKGIPFSTLAADNGNNGSTGDIFSYGVTGSSARSLGTQSGSTPGDSMIGVCLMNTSGHTLTSFNVSYQGQEWRAYCSAPQLLQVAYQIGSPANLNSGTWTNVSGLNFTGPVASGSYAKLVGNVPPNCVNITYTVPVNWPNGTSLWIRWCNGGSIYDGTGNAGLAVANFTFTANNTTTFDADYWLRNEALDSVASVDLMNVGGGGDGVPETRQLTDAARLALCMNIPNAVPKAEYYMQKAFNAQVTSGTYSGNFPWYVTDTGVSDVNSVEFTMLPVAVVFSRYLPLLDGTFVSNAQQYINRAIPCIMAQTPGYGYTNMALNQIANEIVLGQVANSGTSQAKGLTDMNNWVAYIQANGISEYDSPTYGMCDFINLTECLNNLNSTNAALAQAQFEAAANYLSFDFCINYINSYAGSLAGASGRDYTFCCGDDAIDHFYYLAGLRSALPILQPFDGGVDLFANVMEGGYLPPPSILTTATSMPTRAIVQKVGAPVGNVNIGRDRYTYITPNFSIGSSSFFYSFIDKQIVTTFPSAVPMSQVSVIYDQNDDPYGTVLTAEPGTGDLKPEHLCNGSATVQSGGTILSLSNLNTQFACYSGSFNSIGTDFLFPMNANALYLNGNLISGTNTITTATNSVLGVQVGNAIVAVRPFVADGYNGFTPTAYVKFDGQNLGSVSSYAANLPNTGRFVIYQYQGPYTTPPSTTVLRTGFVMAASTATSGSAAVAFLNQIAAAPISTTLTSGTWSASVTLSGTTLAASVTTTDIGIISRTVNGVNYYPQIYTVTSGTQTTDYSAQLLQTIPQN